VYEFVRQQLLTVGREVYLLAGPEHYVIPNRIRGRIHGGG
jgi:hypothetical protein